MNSTWQSTVPVHSGTVPVERIWGNYADYFPDAITSCYVPWWNLLSDLGFLRLNYRHFNRDDLLAFARGDALLAERIDSLVLLARAPQNQVPGFLAAGAEFFYLRPPPAPYAARFMRHIQKSLSCHLCSAFSRCFRHCCGVPRPCSAGILSEPFVGANRVGTNQVHVA